MMNGNGTGPSYHTGSEDSRSDDNEHKRLGQATIMAGGAFLSGNGANGSVVAGPINAGRDRLHAEFPASSQFLTRPAGTDSTHSSILSEQQQYCVDVNAAASTFHHQQQQQQSQRQHPLPASQEFNQLSTTRQPNNPYSVQQQYFQGGTPSASGHDSPTTRDRSFHHPRFISGIGPAEGSFISNSNQNRDNPLQPTATTTTTSDNATAFTLYQQTAGATATTRTTTTTTASNSLVLGSNMGHNGINPSSAWNLQETSSQEKMERAEGKNRDGDSIASSPSLTPLLIPQVDPDSINEAAASAPNIAELGTPSTVSTAPSTTDDGSVGVDSVDKIGLKIDTSDAAHFTLHRREPSWENSPRERHHFTDPENAIGGNILPMPLSASQPTAEGQGQGNPYWLPSHVSPTNDAARLSPAAPPAPQAPSAWGAAHPAQSRVASFRNDAVGESKSDTGTRFTYAQAPNGDRWQQTRHFAGDPQLSYISNQGGVSGSFRPSPGFNPYQVARKPPSPFAQPAMPMNVSPPRNARTPRSQGPSPHRQQQPSTGGSGAVSPAANPARSSSEILKTLLRKKACLYEPDTSRAVALVTWLVGRVLALEYGFFSRQQLQAGVHACVAEKIDTGTITRTKVNRCMQIILNSCFHYIIPRPDGTEEKGSSFRDTFAHEVTDDTALLRLLPVPWNDLTVDKETVIRASSVEVEMKPETASAVSPKASPCLKSTPSSPGRDFNDGDAADVKRAVLLCFNENVRAAEDVFRCHNEFIRDSAHSSNLQLSAQEWRLFFGKEAASTPHIWGNVGIPVVAAESPNGSQRKADALGRMTRDEVGKFRTTWCAKRYDHDHDLCGFAHVEVNGGWLRRNPFIHRYKDELCPSIQRIVDKRVGPHCFVVNECPNGVDCGFAHSHEEITYHPNRYKAKVCPHTSRGGVCREGDICPNHHPSDSSRPAKKSGEGRPPNSRHARGGQPASSSGKNSSAPPVGSPVLYASPAPISSFEKQLLMPGLQNLFRRHCSVVRAHLRNPTRCSCRYSYFGDDLGVDEETPSVASKRP